jgi:hypothetical protein
MKNDLSHLGGYLNKGDPYTWTPDIWGYLVIKYNIQSVVDIGCGKGHNLSWFKSMNIDICGIEGHPDAIKDSVIPGNVVMHDFTQGPMTLDKRYDLALSTEFVEHVENIYENNWMSVLENCDLFLMCHAVPGQGGHHHVNEQPSEYWIEKIEAKGFKHNQELSTLFRNTTSRIPCKWGRNTLLFFER